MPNLLSDYLAQRKLSLRKFGNSCVPPIHHSLIDRYTRGYVPTIAHAIRIEQATSGAVPVASWATILEARPPRKRRSSCA